MESLLLLDVLVSRVTVTEESQFQGIVYLARLICCLHWPPLDETLGRGFQMKDHTKLAPAGAGHTSHSRHKGEVGALLLY